MSKPDKPGIRIEIKGSIIFDSEADMKTVKAFRDNLTDAITEVIDREKSAEDKPLVHKYILSLPIQEK